MPAHRKLVRGVGVNDAPFSVSIKQKPYQRWLNMFARCYGDKNPKHVFYAGCTVDPQWHSYMAFKEWYDAQGRDDWAVDKDLLVPGNKVYGPETCVMLPHYVNRSIERLNAQGWTISNDCNRKKKYEVTVCGKKFGRFETEDEAYAAWKEGRAKHIQSVIDRYLLEDKPDARVVSALENLIL